jgi:hypothetical protein
MSPPPTAHRPPPDDLQTVTSVPGEEMIQPSDSFSSLRLSGCGFRSSCRYCKYRMVQDAHARNVTVHTVKSPVCPSHLRTVTLRRSGRSHFSSLFLFSFHLSCFSSTSLHSRTLHGMEHGRYGSTVLYAAVALPPWPIGHWPYRTVGGTASRGENVTCPITPRVLGSPAVIRDQGGRRRPVDLQSFTICQPRAEGEPGSPPDVQAGTAPEAGGKSGAGQASGSPPVDRSGPVPPA